MEPEPFLISLSEDPVSAFEHGLPLDERFGADQRFLGVVRGTEGERRIHGIDYSCYEPMARRQLEGLCREMARNSPVPHRVLIHHRIGFVAAGEPSIVIRVQTPHSREGFELTREYLRRIKTTVPIWKRPVFVEQTK